MARASTTTLSTGYVTLFNANSGWPGASGSDGSPARSVDLRTLSGSVDFRINGGTAFTLSAGAGMFPVVEPPGHFIAKVEGKGTAASAKAWFRVGT